MRWTRDQLIIAIEFYYICPERMHTHDHAKCKEIANVIGRSAGALEKIIRNIKSADTGRHGLVDASQLIYQLVGNYKHNLPLLHSHADEVRARRNWPVLDCDARTSPP
jgi:hypothetical protein